MKISINTQSIDSIMYLKGDMNYTYIFYENGKKKTMSQTLKRFEESTAFQDWYRVHRAYLVNPKFIASVSLVESFVELCTGTTIPISRRNLVKFKV
jgi:two-component system, LytTR family, response regulator